MLGGVGAGERVADEATPTRQASVSAVPERRTERLLLRGFRGEDLAPLAALNASSPGDGALPGAAEPRGDGSAAGPLPGNTGRSTASAGGRWRSPARSRSSGRGSGSPGPGSRRTSRPAWRLAWRFAAGVWTRGSRRKGAAESLRFRLGAGEAPARGGRRLHRPRERPLPPGDGEARDGPRSGGRLRAPPHPPGHPLRPHGALPDSVARGPRLTRRMPLSSAKTPGMSIRTGLVRRSIEPASGGTMKYLTFIRCSESPPRVLPPAALLEAMGEFVEKPFKNGTLVDTGGLLPSKDGLRVRLGERTDPVTDDPSPRPRRSSAGGRSPDARLEGRGGPHRDRVHGAAPQALARLRGRVRGAAD